jgi:hypothetical protein
MSKEGSSGDSIKQRPWNDFFQGNILGFENKLQTEVPCSDPFTELFSSPFISRSVYKPEQK